MLQLFILGCGELTLRRNGDSPEEDTAGLTDRGMQGYASQDNDGLKFSSWVIISDYSEVYYNIYSGTSSLRTLTQLQPL